MNNGQLAGPDGTPVRSQTTNFQVEVPALFDFTSEQALKTAERMGVDYQEVEGETYTMMMPVVINLTQVVSAFPDTYYRPEGEHPGNYLSGTVVELTSGRSHKLAVPYPLFRQMQEKLGFGAAQISDVQYPEVEWPEQPEYVRYVEELEGEG